MVRGSLPPMWQLGFSVGLPLFAGRKQARAVEEAGHRETADELGAEALRRLLRLRTRERLAVLFALNRTNGHYRKIVLVLSQTTARSTLAQYEVGRVPFASVLEALSGYVADRTSWFDSVAEAQLVAIAVREVSLDPVPFAGSVMSASPMPGGGASNSTTRTSGNQSSTGAETASPQRMGGM